MRTFFKTSLISLFLVSSLFFVRCNKENDETTFNFPIIENIDIQVYNEIKQTCKAHWDLNAMIDTTFEVIFNGNEFSIHCDGLLDGQLYHFVIRVDESGKWINEGRTLIMTSDEFLDVTHMLSYNDFENIKSFILSYGDRQTISQMYNNNPHYSFEGFHTYLNPEIGQLNGDCDPELSDFNELLIRDQNSDPQYFYLHIVRIGDLENDNIARTLPGMIEGKVYLMKYYEYDMDEMAGKVKMYIIKMRDSVE